VTPARHTASPWLITGSSGFLGHEILTTFTAAGIPAIGQAFSRAADPLIRADLRDPVEVERMLSEFRPAGIIHCAACREPDTCEQDSQMAESLNVEPVAHFLHRIALDVPFYFMSSDYVFGGDNPPYREQDPTDPINVYGRTKAAAEKLVLQHPAGVVIRIPVLIGQPAPGTTPGFLQQMVSQVRAGVPVEVDDHFIRYPTWTRDIARYLANVSRVEFSGIIHISAQDGGTRHALTLRIAQALGLSAAHLAPSVRPLDRPALRPNNTHLAIDALQRFGQGEPSTLEHVLAVAVAEGWEG